MGSFTTENIVVLPPAVDQIMSPSGAPGGLGSGRASSARKIVDVAHVLQNSGHRDVASPGRQHQWCVFPTIDFGTLRDQRPHDICVTVE